MRTVRRSLVLAALSALVVAAAPTAQGQTPTVTSVIGAADGLFVDLEVDELTPLSAGSEVAAQQVDLTFGPAPSVTLPPTGGAVSEQILAVDESVALISLTARVLTAAAEGALGPDGFATAESTVSDIFLGPAVTGVRDGGGPGMSAGIQPGLGAILTADLITATCSADLGGVTGSTTLVDATILETTALEAEPEPNTELAVVIAGLGSVEVTLNRQVENSDGSLSVTALVLEVDVSVPEVLSVTGTLEVGPATCGVVEGVTEPAAEVVPAPAQAVPAQARFTG